MSKKLSQKQFKELLPLSLQTRTKALQVLSIMMNQDLIKNRFAPTFKLKVF